MPAEFFSGNPGYFPIARRLKNLKQVSYPLPEVLAGLTRATKQVRPKLAVSALGATPGIVYWGKVSERLGGFYHMLLCLFHQLYSITTSLLILLVICTLYSPINYQLI